MTFMMLNWGRSSKGGFESAVQATLNHLAERDARFAQRKPAGFIEPGPLSEIDRSGFIDRLYTGQR